MLSTAELRTLTLLCSFEFDLPQSDAGTPDEPVGILLEYPLLIRYSFIVS